MTTLNLPNEIINKIFSYIEGNNNQIIKKELINTDTFWSNRDASTCNIKYAFDILKFNLIRNLRLSNNTEFLIRYNKYFKYTVLHINRQYLFEDIKFELRALIDDYNYYNKYYNYTKILTQVRKNYIYDYNYEYNLTNIQLRNHYNVYFKYTILHENRKKVCNHIRRYNTKKRYIFDKKLLKHILLERGILINYIQKDNKRQKKWH
jgi:hypothetical protein